MEVCLQMVVTRRMKIHMVPTPLMDVVGCGVVGVMY